VILPRTERALGADEEPLLLYGDGLPDDAPAKGSAQSAGLLPPAVTVAAPAPALVMEGPGLMVVAAPRTMITVVPLVPV